MLSADDALAKEKCSLQHMRKGDYLEASILLQEIVSVRPDWEHGGAAYSLAIFLPRVRELCEKQGLTEQQISELFYRLRKQYL